MRDRATLAPGMRLRRRLARATAVIPLVLAAAGCSGASHAAQRTVTVQIVADATRGRAYRPERLVVEPSTTVRWVERDTRLHTVTADDNSFGSNFLRTGQTYTVRFNKHGTYAYDCTIHPLMTGEVIVR